MCSKLKRILDPFVSLFYPPVCLACEEPSEGWELHKGICRRCWAGVREVGELICFRCGLPIESREAADASPSYFCSDCRLGRRPYKLLRSLYVYQSPVREMIHLFKYDGKLNIGSELGERLARWAAAHTDFARAEIVVPVPLHPLRRIGRGFNQAEILAGAVARARSIELRRILKRVRNTPPQSRLEPEERRRNVKGAFRVVKNASIRGAILLLVDDVATTETTVRECARTLKSGGAREIYVLTLSRSVER